MSLLDLISDDQSIATSTDIDEYDDQAVHSNLSNANIICFTKRLFLNVYRCNESIILLQEYLRLKSSPTRTHPIVVKAVANMTNHNNVIDRQIFTFVKNAIQRVVDSWPTLSIEHAGTLIAGIDAIGTYFEMLNRFVHSLCDEAEVQTPQRWRLFVDYLTQMNTELVPHIQQVINILESLDGTESSTQLLYGLGLSQTIEAKLPRTSLLDADKFEQQFLLIHDELR